MGVPHTRHVWGVHTLGVHGGGGGAHTDFMLMIFSKASNLTGCGGDT